jgi:host factor-I protein
MRKRVMDEGVRMDGRELEGRIRQFDRFAVIIDFDGTDQMIFKHAIASITMPRSLPNYPSE